MHVLIVPSWYPRFPTEPSGSFFREQAICLQRSGLKVGVAVVELNSLRGFGKPHWKNDISVECDESVITMRKHGWSWFPNMKLGNYLLWRMHSKKLFAEYIKSYGVPDVVHAHSLNMGGIIASRLARVIDRPLIVTEHNSGYILRPDIPVWDKRKYAELFKHSATSIAVSSALAVVINRTWPNAKSEVVANVVDESFFSVSLKSKADDVIRYISIGHLTARKNMCLLIHAFAKAKTAKPSYLTIVGDGEERSNLEKLAIDCGVSERVIFLGNVERDKVASIMTKHDVFVLASNGETFGVVVAEALASGLPVIVTSCGGPEDIVEDSNGYLVDVGDEQGLTSALERASTGYHRFDRCEIRSECKKKYGGSAIAAKLKLIYLQAINRHSEN